MLKHKNKFLDNSKLNDSTSQIYEDCEILSDTCFTVNTITINSLIEKYNISDISLFLVENKDI